MYSQSKKSRAFATSRYYKKTLTGREKRYHKYNTKIIIQPYLMLLLPLEEETATEEFKYMIPHFIICHEQALEFHSSIEPVPESQ